VGDGGHQHPVDELDPVALEGQDLQEDLLGGGRSAAQLQRPDDGVEHLGQPQLLEQRVGLRRRPEPEEQPELGQRDQGLGLRPVVLVAAARVVEGDALRLLTGVALRGVGAGGVRLDREGVPGGQDLQEERQPTPELPGRDRPEDRRVGGDHLVEPDAVHAGRRDGVGTQPVLGEGPAVAGDAEDRGDGVRGAPGVVHHGAVDFLHADEASLS